MPKLPALNRSYLPVDQALPIRFLQFGGGNFLRGFTDWMITELNEKTNFGGGVAIVKPTKKGDYDKLRAQEGLFHVVLNGFRDGEFYTEKRLITCVQRIIHPYREWETYLELAENPELRFILSNTTEAGIQFNPADRLSDQPPQEFPAKLTRWLYHRFQYFSGDLNKTCIFLPLELVEQNGDLLRQCLLQYANHWQLEALFKEWLMAQTYCNTLVDRIVAGYPHESADELQAELGLEDACLVAGEYYHSWIIEGPAHVAKELPFAETGLNVRLTDNLAIHREIKVRILNGAHTSMVPIGLLAGAQTVGEAMQHESLAKLIETELFQEIIPTIEHPAPALKAFARDVLDRFRNPTLQHRLIDIALNSTSKFVARLLPSLLAYQQQKGELPPFITFAFAALIQLYRGNWQGEVFALRDAPERLAFFQQVWTEKGQDLPALVETILAQESIWGRELQHIPGLQDALIQNLNSLQEGMDLSSLYAKLSEAL